MKRLWLTAFTICVALAARPALAQSADPTAHRHLGFFLQLDAGPGFLSTSASAGGLDVKLSGSAFDFSLAIGGAVSENFIVAGHFWGATASSPKVEVGGLSASASGAELDLSALGVNLTYYFMPVNLYVSVTPSITTLSIKQGGGLSASTEKGFGLRAAVGKEWWVGDHWGIGLNGQMAFASNKNKGDPAPTWGSFWGGLALSATYN